MKLKLITLTALSALALGGSVLANDLQDNDRPGGRGGMRHGGLNRIVEDLNLTPDQKNKVQPIIDQAQPQLENIRREAMEKTKNVMQNTMSQIRPLLTADQQKKLDEMKNDRHGFRGHRHHHDQGDETDLGGQ
jgi:Spy/CpxP family protein refolding chaperone